MLWSRRTHTLMSNLRLFIKHGRSMYFWITKVLGSGTRFIFRGRSNWVLKLPCFLFRAGDTKPGLFWFSMQWSFIIFLTSFMLLMTWIPLPLLRPVGSRCSCLRSGKSAWSGPVYFWKSNRPACQKLDLFFGGRFQFQNFLSTVWMLAWILSAHCSMSICLPPRQMCWPLCRKLGATCP